MTLRWYFEVDWDRDGSYESDEAGRLQALTVRRGRRNRIKANGKGLEPVGVGSARVVLENYDQRYDPWNTSSPLYPNVEPGRPCRLRVEEIGGDVYPVMVGVINDIQSSSFSDRAVFTIEEVGAKLRRSIATTVQVNEDVDTLISTVLTAAGWGGGSVSGLHLDVIPYWWPTQETALGCLWDIAETFLGEIIIARDGMVHTISRGMPTLSTSALTEDELLRDIFVPQPWENIYNRIIVANTPRTVVADQTLWQLEEPVLLAQGDAFQIDAPYTYDGAGVPAINLAVPSLASGTFAANSQPDGSGTDRSGSFTISMTAYATYATLTVTYSGAGAPAYVTTLALIGDALAPTGAQTVVSENSTSQTKYGVRSLEFRSDLQQYYPFAVDKAAYVMGRLISPALYPVVKLQNRPAKQFDLELFSIVTLTIASRGISGTFQIAGVEHKASDPTCQKVVTTYWLQPYWDQTMYWNFPDTLGVGEFGF